MWWRQCFTWLWDHDRFQTQALPSCRRIFSQTTQLGGLQIQHGTTLRPRILCFNFFFFSALATTPQPSFLSFLSFPNFSAAPATPNRSAVRPQVSPWLEGRCFIMFLHVYTDMPSYAVICRDMPILSFSLLQWFIVRPRIEVRPSAFCEFWLLLCDQDMNGGWYRFFTLLYQYFVHCLSITWAMIQTMVLWKRQAEWLDFLMKEESTAIVFFVVLVSIPVHSCLLNCRFHAATSSHGTVLPVTQLATWNSASKTNLANAQTLKKFGRLEYDYIRVFLWTLTWGHTSSCRTCDQIIASKRVSGWCSDMVNVRKFQMPQPLHRLLWSHSNCRSQLPIHPKFEKIWAARWHDTIWLWDESFLCTNHTKHTHTHTHTWTVSQVIIRLDIVCYLLLKLNVFSVSDKHRCKMMSESEHTQWACLWAYFVMPTSLAIVRSKLSWSTLHALNLDTKA